MVARAINHSLTAVERYLEDFKRLVEAYHSIFDEYAVINAKFDALLKGSSKN